MIPKLFKIIRQNHPNKIYHYGLLTKSYIAVTDGYNLITYKTAAAFPNFDLNLINYNRFLIHYDCLKLMNKYKNEYVLLRVDIGFEYRLCIKFKNGITYYLEAESNISKFPNFESILEEKSETNKLYKVAVTPTILNKIKTIIDSKSTGVILNFEPVFIGEDGIKAIKVNIISSKIDTDDYICIMMPAKTGNL